MRTALVSLLATAALVSAAQAQTPAAPAAQPTPTPAAPQSAPPAPAATPAAPPAPSATTPPAPSATTPPAPGAAPAAPGAPPAAVLQILDKVCVPLVRGGNFEQLMKANGFRLNRRDGTWTAPLGTTSKDYTITMSPPGINKDVCRGEVHYASGEDKPIVSAINVWAFLHQPQMDPTANYVAVDPDGIKRVRKSWEHLDSTSSIGVNFSTWTKPDDSPLNPKYSIGEIYYQERKLS
jgi:hypothetical protein